MQTFEEWFKNWYKEHEGGIFHTTIEEALRQAWDASRADGDYCICSYRSGKIQVNNIWVCGFCKKPRRK